MNSPLNPLEFFNTFAALESASRVPNLPGLEGNHAGINKVTVAKPNATLRP